MFCESRINKILARFGICDTVASFHGELIKILFCDYSDHSVFLQAGCPSCHPTNSIYFIYFILRAVWSTQHHTLWPRVGRPGGGWPNRGCSVFGSVHGDIWGSDVVTHRASRRAAELRHVRRTRSGNTATPHCLSTALPGPTHTTLIIDVQTLEKKFF